MYRNSNIQFSRQLKVPYNYRDKRRILTNFIIIVYLIGFVFIIMVVSSFFLKRKVLEDRVVIHTKPNQTENLIEEKLDVLTNISTNLTNETVVDIKKQNYYNSIFDEKCSNMFEEKIEVNNIIYIDKEVTKVQMVSEFNKNSFSTDICFNENQKMISIPSVDVKCIEFENVEKKTTSFMIKLSAVKIEDDNIHLYTFWTIDVEPNQRDNDDQSSLSSNKLKYCDLNIPKETILDLKMQLVLEISWDYSLQKNICFPNINLIN